MIALNKTGLPRRGFQNKHKLFLIALPFLLLVLVFSYGPLLGWVISFFKYKPGNELQWSDWNNFASFKSLFGNATQRGEILRVMRNTAAISLLGLTTSFLPVIFAVFLAEIRLPWFKKSIQILTTLPNFVSWVLVYSFAFALFSLNNGLVNNLLIKLGVIQINKPIDFLASPNSDWTIWLQMCAWGIWKGLGWGAIMYLAAIAGIDQELYEAARVDGAGRFRMMWHITVPGIMETFFVLLLLSIANFINNGFEQYFMFQNAMNKSYIEVLDLYVYNVTISSGSNHSLTTAISMLKSLISVSLLMIANQLSKDGTRQHHHIT